MGAVYIFVFSMKFGVPKFFAPSNSLVYQEC